MSLVHKHFLMDFLSSLVTVWHIDFSQGFTSHWITLLVKIGLQELIVSEASCKVKTSWCENDESLHRDVDSIEILHQLIDSSCKGEFFKLLMWLLFRISEPVAEFLNLMSIIITLLISSVDILFIQHVVDVGPHVGNIPITSTISPNWTHRAAE